MYKIERWSVESMNEFDNFDKRNSLDGIEVLIAVIASDVFVSSCPIKCAQKGNFKNDHVWAIQNVPLVSFVIASVPPECFTLCSPILPQKNQRKSFKTSIRFSAQFLILF